MQHWMCYTRCAIPSGTHLLTNVQLTQTRNRIHSLQPCESPCGHPPPGMDCTCGSTSKDEAGCTPGHISRRAHRRRRFLQDVISPDRPTGAGVWWGGRDRSRGNGDGRRRPRRRLPATAVLGGAVAIMVEAVASERSEAAAEARVDT